MQHFHFILGHVALGVQWPIVVKLSHERSVGPSVGRSVCPSLCLSSALWKNGGSDPDAVRYRRLDRCRDEADDGVWGSVHGKGYFWGQIWGTSLSTGHIVLAKLLWPDLLYC